MTDMNAPWGPITDGFSVGPTRDLHIDNAQTITVQTLWTTEGGVAVSLDTDDQPIPAEVVPEVLDTIKDAAAVPPPTEAAG